MNKILIWFFGICSCVCFVIAGICLIDHFRPPRKHDSLKPFHSILRDQGNHSFRGTFRSEYSKTHYVDIIYPQVTADIEVNKILKKWRGIEISNEDKLPGPDLYWQVLYKNKIIGKGGGESGWIGAGSAYGEFEVKSGCEYELHVSFGPKFQPFLNQSPEIEIGVAHSGGMSVGAAVERALNIPFSIGFGIAGLVFLLCAIAAYVWKSNAH